MAEVDPSLKAEVAIDGYRNSLLAFGNFTLRSGAWSPYYFDVRPVPSISVDELRTDMSRADQLRFRHNAVNMYAVLLDQVAPYDHIQAIPEAVSHLIGMIGYAHNDSVLHRRVNQKDHGSTTENILGHWNPGDVSVLVDDVISTSGAKVAEKTLVEDVSRERDDDDEPISEGLRVNDAVVMIDREQEGIEKAQEAGLSVIAGLTITEFIEIPHAEGIMLDEAYAVIEGYRKGEIKVPEDISPTWHNFEIGKKHSQQQAFS